MEMSTIIDAPVTPAEAKRRVTAMIRARMKASGLEDRGRDAFDVQAWNDRGTTGGPDHIRLRIERQAEISEGLSHPIRTDVRWPDRRDVQEAVDDHVHRYVRTVRRHDAGGRTQQSHGDPSWMMTIHRAVAEILHANGISVTGHHDWMGLRDAIGVELSMLNLSVDAGRIHPLAMRIARRRSDSLGIYVSASALCPDPMTSIVLPCIIPEITMAASSGRMLGDIIRIPGVSGDHVIRRITRSDVTGTTIELEHDEVAIAVPPDAVDMGWMDRHPPAQTQSNIRRLAA